MAHVLEQPEGKLSDATSDTITCVL